MLETGNWKLTSVVASIVWRKPLEENRIPSCRHGELSHLRLEQLQLIPFFRRDTKLGSEFFLKRYVPLQVAPEKIKTRMS